MIRNMCCQVLPREVNTPNSYESLGRTARHVAVGYNNELLFSLLSARRTNRSVILGTKCYPPLPSTGKSCTVTISTRAMLPFASFIFYLFLFDAALNLLMKKPKSLWSLLECARSTRIKNFFTQKYTQLYFVLNAGPEFIFVLLSPLVSEGKAQFFDT